MSNVFFIGDLHFGHTHIPKFRKQFPTEGQHTAYIMSKWIDTVGHRDKVFVMGDAAFTKQGLDLIGTLPGRKVLIKGNHDLLPIDDYLSVFEEVHGLYHYKKFWLSHCPIHPNELHGRDNIHGHCHRGEYLGTGSFGEQYFNTCAEHLPTPYVPVDLHTVNTLVNHQRTQL